MNEAEMDCVEKMLTSYIEKTIRGVRADYFRKAMKLSQTETSLDAIAEPDALFMLQQETLCGSRCGGCKNEMLCAAIESLTERQEVIIAKIYKDKYTEAEVAWQLGTSQQLVHFHKDRAITKLRFAVSRSVVKNKPGRRGKEATKNNV